MLLIFCFGLTLLHPATAFSKNSDWQDERCKGRMQSPIKIRRRSTVHSRMEKIRYNGYDVQRRNVILENNGHTAMLTLAEEDEKPYIDRGGLGAKYTFDQLHFHWSRTNSEGAEHTFESWYNSSTPKVLEVHFVHSNTDGATDEKAQFAVLAWPLMSVSKVNRAYTPITNAFKDIRHKGKKTVIGGFTLESLLPRKTYRNMFYRYNGSLTTPPCTESVIWTVFEDFYSIGRAQMDQFRTLLATPEGSEEKSIAPNFRETQPLNGRTVYRVTTR